MKILNTKFKNGKEIKYLFNFLPLYITKIKKPEFDENTFFVWEPCTANHAEVVPGYTKYLLDLGYKVSVLFSQVKSNTGLFSRFKENKNLIVNNLTKKEAKKYFKYFGLGNAKGIMITTGGLERDKQYKFTQNKLPFQKVLRVEHSAHIFDTESKDEKIVTLRKMNYKGAETIEVNAHYFGNINVTPKNKDIINFIVIGALQKKRRNTDILINAVDILVKNNITNFKITVVGKGSLNHLPKHLRKYFEIKGRLNFEEMYSELENADFFLPLLDVFNKNHENTITTSTSGSFQLIYGFRLPAIIAEKFATVNGFTNENSILYVNNEDLADAMKNGIKLSDENYTLLQKNLAKYADSLYNRSIENLKELIDES